MKKILLYLSTFLILINGTVAFSNNNKLMTLKDAKTNWFNPSSQTWLKQKAATRTTLFRSAIILDESFYTPISLPYVSTNASFDTLTTASIFTLPGYGDFPGRGFKITIPNDTTLNFIFASSTINMYGVSISKNVDQSNPTMLISHLGQTDILTAGTYYVVIFTNYQEGTYSMFLNDYDPSPSLSHENITLPYDTLNAVFDLTTKVVPLSNLGGSFPVKEYAFTLAKDTVVSLNFNSTAINQYALVISQNQDLSSPDTIFGSGIDTLTAGTYYLGIVSNYQYGNYTLRFQEGIPDSVLTYQSISLPFNTANASFALSNTIMIPLFGAKYPALGYTFSLAKDTVLSLNFSSSDIPDYILILGKNKDFSDGLIYSGGETDTLTAGTYYLGLVTQFQYGNYSLSISEFNPIITQQKNVLSDNSLNIYSDNKTILIRNATMGSRVMIYDVLGNAIVNTTIDSSLQSFNMQNRGLYIVRIGDKTQKLLVK